MTKQAGLREGSGNGGAPASATDQTGTIQPTKRVADKFETLKKQMLNLGSRPKPITAAEALQWFTDHIRNNAHIPTEAQIAPFVERMNHDIELNWRTKDAWRGTSDSVLPGVREFRTKLFSLREDLDDFAVIPGFWASIGISDATMEKLRQALAELGTFPQPPAKTGRKPEPWHAFAICYSSLILRALAAAGFDDASQTNKEGPVPRIGADALKAVLGITIKPPAFAAAVVAQQKRRTAQKRIREEKFGKQ